MGRNKCDLSMGNTRTAKRAIVKAQSNGHAKVTLPYRFTLPDAERQEGLALHLKVKEAEQAYTDWVLDAVRTHGLDERMRNLGRVNITYDPLTGRFTVNPAQG